MRNTSIYHFKKFTLSFLLIIKYWAWNVNNLYHLLFFIILRELLNFNLNVFLLNCIIIFQFNNGEYFIVNTLFWHSYYIIHTVIVIIRIKEIFWGLQIIYYNFLIKINYVIFFFLLNFLYCVFFIYSKYF